MTRPWANTRGIDASFLCALFTWPGSLSEPGITWSGEMKKWSMVMAVALAGMLGAGRAWANEALRAEIMEHVVTPCYAEIAKRNPVEGVSVEQMTELALLVNASEVENVMETLLPMVQDQDSLEVRRMLYQFSRLTCIGGASGTTADVGNVLPASPAVVETSGSVPVEPKAVIGPNISGTADQQELLDELVGMIRAKGWHCDSVSGARNLVFSRGFRVHCNDYAYKYKIKNRGGNWEVTVD